MSRTIIGPLVTTPAGLRCSHKRLERAARQLVVAFDRLVAVGRGADGDVVALPGRLLQLAAQHLDEVRLDEDDRRELVVRAQLELRVVAARVAVVAAVRAAAVRIEGPLEGHALDRIERRPAADFLISRGVGAPRRLGEGVGAASEPDQIGDVAGRRLRLAEVKEQRRRFHGASLVSMYVRLQILSLGTP